jgi:superfamily II DNA or RNA helicase
LSTPSFFLSPQSILAKVDAGTYQRGLSVYLNQQVLNYEVNYSNNLVWDIEGTVQGSHKERYFVTVAVELDKNGRLSHFSGDCTCPVEVNCKHAVALTVKAAYQAGKGDAAASPPRSSAFATSPMAKASIGSPIRNAAPKTPTDLQAQKETQQRIAQERERQLAQHKVDLWLNQFGQAAEAQTHAAEARTAPEDDERMVYMLHTQPQDGHAVLQLSYAKSRVLRNGKWAKAKIPSYLSSDGLSAQDKEITGLIRAQTSNSGSSYYSNPNKATLTGETGSLALSIAAATGYLFYPVEERVLTTPVRLGPPRALQWQWSEVPATPSTLADPLWHLQATVAAPFEGTPWFANSPPLYLDAAAGLCGPVESPGISAAHLALLLKTPPIPQSAFAKHETRLLSHFAGLPLPPVLTPPTVLQGITPQAHLLITHVAANDTVQRGLLSASLHFDYNGLPFYRRSTQSPVLLDAPPATATATPLAGGKTPPRLLLHRDTAAEKSAHNALTALGLTGNPYGVFHLLPPHSQHPWLHWADTDFAPLRDAGFTVTVDAALNGWIARADSLDVAMTPGGGNASGHHGDFSDLAGSDDSQSPWFDLSLGMQINGERHNILPLLPELLAQLRDASTAEESTAQLPSFIYLPNANGGYLRLPTAPLRPWLQALLDLVGERTHNGGLNGDSLRLSRLEALRVGAALGQGAQWSGADSLRQMVTQLAGHSAIPEVPLPTGLNAELRPYQQQGLNWLQFLRSHGLAGILADDMGLGKTLQTLAHLLVEKQAGRLDRPALIIAPVSLMGNWRREANRFTPELKTLVLHGAERHEAATEIALHDVVIAPYSLLQRDRERWTEQPWHIVVLDEAQNIKNANSYAAQVVSELNTRHRLCLSGTPMENHLGELWSLFHFLMPGFLGSQARFKDLFRTPIEKQGDSARLDQLRRRVTPFMLRRAKRDVATDLPDKQEFVSSVELSGKQADLYETIRLATEKAVREALDNKGLAKSQIQILDALLKLRQVCCDPRLVPLDAAKKIKQSAKLELLMELLPEMLAEGRRILLFSQFTSMLTLIEDELKARKIPWVKLTGQSQKRDELIERFTSGQVPLFLISLKAGGVGLNLPQADTVIHYDPWWNPAVENQATDRAHRIGQTQSVFVYKLVAQGTIEERILALQARKAALADSLYSGSQGRKQPLFTEDDVAELLKPLGS